MDTERRSSDRGNKRLLATVFGMLTATFLLNAHAIVKESTPKPGSVVQGPNITIRLRFNSRIDAAHSRIWLTAESGAKPVDIDRASPAGTLLGKAIGVRPGAYHIQWQVLATDGHITRGEVPFSVR
jgi:copper resistance protein C